MEISLDEGLTILKETVFGWVVLEKYVPRIVVCLATTNEELDQELTKFWELEQSVKITF
jgi:hypothetical protein